MRLTQISGDLFSAAANVSLAHCVGADLTMKAGIAVMFKKHFGGTDELLAQKAKTGGVAVLKHNDRFVYYLVTKPWSTDKPTYANLARSLGAMREHMLANNVTQLAMPRIGCGIDGMEWDQVEAELQKAFGQPQSDNVEITVYNFVPK